MISGMVTEDGVPIIELSVAGSIWRAIVDTGFNSDLELPLALKSLLRARATTVSPFLLAGGVRVEEMVYVVEFPFDGELVRANATFVDGHEILLGTGLLMKYRLAIDFPARTVQLQRVNN